MFYHVPTVVTASSSHIFFKVVVAAEKKHVRLKTNKERREGDVLLLPRSTGLGYGPEWLLYS